MGKGREHQLPTDVWLPALGLEGSDTADPADTVRIATEHRARIVAALARAGRSAGVDPAGPVPPARRLALIRQAAAALFKDGHAGATAALCAAAGSPAPLLRLQVRALQALDDPARLADTVTALAGRDDLDPELRTLLDRVRRQARAAVPAAAAAAAAALPPEPLQGGGTLPAPLAGMMLEPRFAGPGGISTADHAAIAAALARVAATPGPGSGAGAAAPGRIALATMAARDLFQANQPGPAAILASSASPSPGALKILLWALEVQERDAEVQQVLAETAATPDLPPDLVDYIYGQRVRHGVGLGAADHLRFWGPMGPDLATTLAGLGAPPSTRNFFAELSAVLHDIRAAHGIAGDAAEFAARLTWGYAAEMYLRFLNRARAPRRSWAGADADTRHFQALCREADALHVDDTGGAVAATIAAGRGVVMTRAHAGISNYYSKLFAEPGLPAILVAANAGGGNGGDDINMGTRSNLQTNFTKTVKRVRKAPHFVTIFPEGGHGADLLSFDLLGRRVQLGQGAATLAWHGRAAVFFYATEWRDGRVHSVLRPGPVADHAAMDRAAFDAAFYDFYLGCLRDIVLGPPEDMVGNAGFWPMLVK